MPVYPFLHLPVKRHSNVFERGGQWKKGENERKEWKIRLKESKELEIFQHEQGFPQCPHTIFAVMVRSDKFSSNFEIDFGKLFKRIKILKGRTIDGHWVTFCSHIFHFWHTVPVPPPFPSPGKYVSSLEVGTLSQTEHPRDLLLPVSVACPAVTAPSAHLCR